METRTARTRQGQREFAGNEPIDPLLRNVAQRADKDLADIDALYDDLPIPDERDSHDVIAVERRSSEAGSTVAESRRERRKQRRRKRRRVRRVALCILLVVLLPAMWSYGRALTGPGSDSLQARTVEWARDNHLGWAVDRAEKWWFAHHQAKLGGTPDLSAGPEVISIPTAPATAPTPTPATSVAVSSASPVAPAGVGVAVANTLGPDLTSVPVTVADPRAGHLPLPAALSTPAAEPVAGEGQWTPLGPDVGGIPGAYVTSIRPDAEHTSVLDAIVWIDPTVFSLRQYPGTKIPGAPWDRPDHVESRRQAGLVAAFAGGFRLRDSNGGIIIGHRTLQPMRDGGATLAIDDNGMPNVGAWGVDITNSAILDSARQSLDLIVIDGAPAPDLTTDANRKWGFTGPANKTAVWRSGAGIRADGALVWVGGNGFTIETLAETLVRAGAIRGMQLEINQEWVQFNTYATGTDGQVHGKRLMKGMQHTGDRWLTEDTRDFIAVFTRES